MISLATLVEGRYALGETIAIGGAYTIARAHDTRLRRDVAIKRARTPDAASAARLRIEASMLARCAHPGVVGCLDLIDDLDGGPALVLQLVESGNLAQHTDIAPIHEALARTWIDEVASAVDHLHTRNIAHGDLKPGNVMVDTDGRVVLVDFDRAGDASPDAIDDDRRALDALRSWLLERSEVVAAR